MWANVIITIKSTHMPKARHSTVWSALSHPLLPLQNSDDRSHLTEMETEVREWIFPKPHSKSAAESEPEPRPCVLWPLLPATSRFIPVGKPPGDGGSRSHTVTPPPITPAPGPSRDGIAHVTQPSSQRELCALCPGPASATRSPSPSWGKSRERDTAEMGGGKSWPRPLKWHESDGASSLGLGCKRLVPAQ